MDDGVPVGLLLGAGVFLIWWSCWADGPAAALPSAGPGPIRAALTAAGWERVSPAALLAGCVLAAVTAFLLLFGVSGSPAVAGCFGVLAGWGPWAWVRATGRRRRAVRRELWPEVVDNLTSAVRAGLSLPEALAQLGDRGPAPLREPFAAFGRDYRATGRFGDSLDLLKDRLADPVADRICEALRVTREVGGSDLGRLLRSLSAFLRDDARTRGELEARQTWTVNGARVAVAAPWLVLAMLSTRPQAVAAYDSGTGAAVLATGGLVCAVAYRLMLRLGRLPDDERVLR